MQGKALVTGAGGLIGVEICRFLLEKGFDVQGVDNNLRRFFFGLGGDTTTNIKLLKERFHRFKNATSDIRNREAMLKIMESQGPFDLIVHTAAQPSHDWAAREPLTDFDVNAVGTMNLLEGFRLYSSKGVFVFTSTNKVYGDNPNKVGLVETDTRYDYAEEQEIQGVSQEGIDETMSLDNCIHSIFGASKVAADVMCQEYGKYFGLNVGIFRGGCLTGSQHSAVELHGFLTYLIQCSITGKPYTIFGYKGKQVRDQIHSSDVVSAFWHFFQSPKQGEVYNLGGTKQNAASIIEVINLLQERFGITLNHSYLPQNRNGDHICYYSNMRKFRMHYPHWQIKKNLVDIIEEIIEGQKERWTRKS